MNKVLIVSTEFPPAARSSGVQRIFNFSKYLPSLGWESLILTMHPMAYGAEVSQQQLSESSKFSVVKRALAFNTAIHFSIKGRYLSWMALPDRWGSWVFFGFFSGLRMIKQYQPKVIFSSYPHASAHLLGLLLHKVTGLPWVADFRDPMLYYNIYVEGFRHKIYQWIEKETIKYCSCAVFTTPSAIEEYIKIKYPEYPDYKWCLIENGFDEQDFIEAEERVIKANNTTEKKKIVLLHSGGIFPEERDPTCFFKALSFLMGEGTICPSSLEVVLRAPGNEKKLQEMINIFGLQKVVYIRPRLNYSDALDEMLSVDGLLVLQGSICNFQIPAKVYEYLRAKKPILALTDFIGDTATFLRKANINSIAPLDNELNIIEKLRLFLHEIKGKKSSSIASVDFIVEQSRQARTIQLAEVLNRYV